MFHAQVSQGPHADSVYSGNTSGMWPRVGLSTGPMLAVYQTACDSTVHSCPHYADTLQVLSTALTDVQVNI